MRRTHVVLPILAGLVLLVAGCAPADDADSEPAGLTEREGAAIAEASSRWAQAVETGDLDRLASLYAEDAVLMPPGAPAVHGRQAIREFLATFPAVESATLTQEDVEGRGDLAYVVGSYELTMLAVPGDTASRVTDRGKFVEIRERREDGSWPMVVDIWNSSGPAAATAEDTAADMDDGNAAGGDST